MDTKGKLRYKILDTEYSFGSILDISETYNKSASTFPIVTLSYKDTFALESASILNYTIKFNRVQPEKINDETEDSTLWSNEHWFNEITNIIDRWQAQTDGGVLEYIPDSDNPYIPPFRYNGYIKSISKTYSEGRISELQGSMEFHVGTMFVNTIVKEDYTNNSVRPVLKDDFLILMSDANQTAWYPLLRKVFFTKFTLDINCVTSYTLFGGIEEPFERAVIHIPKERLSTLAPELDIASNIISGKNKIIIEAVGKSSMCLANSSLNNDEYRLDAYCDAVILRDKLLDVDYSDTPFNIIEKILSEGTYGVSFRKGVAPNPNDSKDSGVRGTFIFSYFEKDSLDDKLFFKQGENVWDILQVCATYLGCKIFFANGNAYLIDYRRHEHEDQRITSVNPAPVEYPIDHALLLQPDDPSDPAFSRLVGNIELDAKSSGLISVINVQPVKCLCYNADGEPKKILYEDGINQASIDTFGRQEGDVLDVPGIIQGKNIEGTSLNQAKTFVDGYLDYRAEPQQAIRFTFKEMQKNARGEVEWAPFFEPTALLGSIESRVNKTNISNISVLNTNGPAERVPQKLILTQFERNYPKGTTTYTFGQIGSIDLSSSTSQIMSNLNSV